MEKIVVGPIDGGLKNDRTAFVINNDNFPKLVNAYQWRGRVKRKRGTEFLNRLQRYFNSLSTAYNSGSTTITLDGSGNGNLLTGFSLQTNGNITPGSVTITAPGPTVFTDPAMNGTLSPSGSINYASGAFTIASEAGEAVSATFNYTPNLPVMGLEDLILQSINFPGNLAFDTKYSYNIVTSEPYSIYDVGFYKNLPTGTYPSYVQKTTWTPTSWNGQNYQQFWSTNYENVFWVTNGITVPYTTANVGMQFKPIASVTVISGGPPATATLTIVGHGLVVGDFVFINEVATTTGINFQTGYVITVTDANNVIVEFPSATIATNGTGGIAQYLTSRADPTKDCLRWYDGDPTNGNVSSPGFIPGNGWVNFMPPLSNLAYSIANLPQAQYYLVGARFMLAFKDRLLFFGPVVQTSSTPPVYLKDTVIFSQNGTPFYTCSFTGDPTLTNTVFNPILVPSSQTSTANSWFEDVTGYGGFRSAAIDQEIINASPNEDTLIVAFRNIQTKLIFSGNDIQPFNFYTVNSEYGSSSTFSVINMDEGVLTRGLRGYVISSQVGSKRIDLDIPDQVFQINLITNGNERFTAQRDFINEWIYFTYNSNSPTSVYPNQTLQFNHRDNSWAIFNESYTTYGAIRRVNGQTWATIGQRYASWKDWNDPWNAGESTLEQQEVIAGNQQGFVFIRGVSTGEGNSLYINNISSSTVTSPDHNLNSGDYIVISGCLGTIGPIVNGNIYSVNVTDSNTFTLNPTIASGTYLGGGLIQRMYVPSVQTKQFPVAWSLGRKTRIGVQQYLLTTTPNGQIQLQIYLSQDASNPYNLGPIVPANNSQNNSLTYNSILYTCPESTNLGLTPANINLQTLTAASQSQLWHRVNTSLIGDTVQLGFTMSDDQMRDKSFSNQFAEIEIHAFTLEVSPSQLLV